MIPGDRKVRILSGQSQMFLTAEIDTRPSRARERDRHFIIHPVDSVMYARHASLRVTLRYRELLAAPDLVQELIGFSMAKEPQHCRSYPMTCGLLLQACPLISG